MKNKTEKLSGIQFHHKNIVIFQTYWICCTNLTIKIQINFLPVIFEDARVS